jgi:sugar-specific transcriptional regulator TrmB
MQLNQTLQKLEISPTASRVYIALLELGKATADKIAKRAQTYKANVYDALDRLSEVGLATYIIEDNKRFFIPTNPEKLPQIIKEIEKTQEQKIKELKKDLNTILPNLKAKYNSVKDKELFEVYKGRKAYKALINEILKENPKEWKGFGNFQIEAAFPIEFPRWFKKVKLKLFSTKNTEVLKLKKQAEKEISVNVTWLPEEIYMPIVWVVFGNNVLIIIYEPDLILLRIKSKQVVKTFSSQFDYLWGKYKK